MSSASLAMLNIMSQQTKALFYIAKLKALLPSGPGLISNYTARLYIGELNRIAASYSSCLSAT